ncbi:MAG: LptE family protein [Candidatus Saccharicenans sp.]|nr:LptE family protein [Candidatus Saccharicenans sp.]
MKFWPKYIACGLALACLVACGYQLRGKGGFWPRQMKKIQVPVFQNSSGRFELDLKLTRSVINELVARTGVVIVGQRSQADGLLSGEVRSFSVQPIAFSPTGTATRFKITIVTSVVFSDLVNQKILFSDDNFVYTEEYDLPEGLDYETMETRAIDRAAEKYARQLVVNLVEGF